MGLAETYMLCDLSMLFRWTIYLAEGVWTRDRLRRFGVV